MKIEEARREIKAKAEFCFPTPENPFYHLKIPFRFSDNHSTTDYQLKEVKVNGKEIIDFYLYSNGKPQKEQKLRYGNKYDVVVRHDWLCGEEVQLSISGEADGGKGSVKIISKAKAPEYGGYWNTSWKHYAGIVVTENAGLERVNEPVHVTFALYSDRIKDPARELRIISIDPKSGSAEEIGSQTHSISHYDCKQPGERYQPTTTFEAVFFANIPANSSKVYLAFYGNLGAQKPSYNGGLKVQGKEPGLTLENPYYTIHLAPTSGCIDEIEMKMGVNYKFEHYLETNGALHWNPDVYAPPRPWLHTSDWNPPAHFSSITGEIFTMTRRHGPIDYYPEVEASITYTFYEKVPWMVITSSIEVKKDIDVQALRNGEIVLNRELVKEFAWAKPGGGYETMLIQEGPRHPKHAKVLPYRTPWACLFTREHNCGLGILTLSLSNFNKYGGYARTFQPYSYLQWGPWVYYARPIVYTFLSNNPARLITVPEGNIYFEKMALVPIKIDNTSESFKYLERLHAQLTNPLNVKVIEDTDPRAPREWIPPILVEEFEEIEEAKR